MSDEKIEGILRKVKAPCLRCNNEVAGFMIPDGRFICPNCDPKAVYDRWQREWTPFVQKVKAERAAKAAAERAEEKAAMKERYAEMQREKAKDKARAIEARREKRAAWWHDFASNTIRPALRLLLAGMVFFVLVVIASLAFFGAPGICVIGIGCLIAIAYNLPWYLKPGDELNKRLAKLGANVAGALFIIVLGVIVWHFVEQYKHELNAINTPHYEESAYERGAQEQLEADRRRINEYAERQEALEKSRQLDAFQRQLNYEMSHSSQ